MVGCVSVSHLGAIKYGRGQISSAMLSWIDFENDKHTGWTAHLVHSTLSFSGAVKRAIRGENLSKGSHNRIIRWESCRVHMGDCVEWSTHREHQIVEKGPLDKWHKSGVAYSHGYYIAWSWWDEHLGLQFHFLSYLLLVFHLDSSFISWGQHHLSLIKYRACKTVPLFDQKTMTRFILPLLACGVVFVAGHLEIVVLFNLWDFFLHVITTLLYTWIPLRIVIWVCNGSVVDCFKAA